jgi:hypothetical protein
MDRYVEQLRDSELPTEHTDVWMEQGRTTGTSVGGGDRSLRRRTFVDYSVVAGKTAPSGTETNTRVTGSSKAPTGRWRHSRNLVIRPETRICCPSWTRFMGG